jgi:hypothetical protein
MGIAAKGKICKTRLIQRSKPARLRKIVAGEGDKNKRFVVVAKLNRWSFSALRNKNHKRCVHCGKAFLRTFFHYHLKNCMKKVSKIL